MILDKNDLPKVLIVDDKPENTIILVHMLESLNIELFVAFSGQDALQRVKEDSFDLILLDIIMPDINGYTVCQSIKNNQQTSDTPVVFVSSLCGLEDRIKGFSYGADDYISKPIVQKELVARVSLHLHKRMIFKSLKHLLRKSYHELYNPLAIINTSLEMQNIKHGSNRYMDSIAVASKTLQLVYDDLYYSFSKTKQYNDIVRIDLVSFLQKRITFFASLSNSKNITIDFTGEKGNFIHMREADLLRIVDNTLSNAIKYSKTGTIIVIEIIDAEESMIFVCQNSGSVIKDTKKIFDFGYREAFEQVGMGIGLEIVASICHSNNIKPDVLSKDSLTSFRYEIPKAFKGK